MRIGIMGFGRAGTTHFDACETIAGMSVVAVQDPTPASRQAARERGARAYASAAALLHDESPDAVIIAAPPADHVPLAMMALSAGVPVLCEKPLAKNGMAAVPLLKAAQRRGRLLQVASKFRHVPEIVTLRDAIGSGALGEILHFEVSFCSVVDMIGRWNAVPARSGGGVIIDNGCHAFDILHFLFGGIDAVQAAKLPSVQPLLVEDSASLQIRTSDGIVGSVLLSWSWSTERDVYLVVQGSRARYEIGWKASRSKQNGEDWCTFGQPYSKLDAHRRMLLAFRDAVNGSAPPWITFTECAEIAATVDACYASLRSGRWQSVAVAEGLQDEKSFATGPATSVAQQA